MSADRRRVVGAEITVWMPRSGAAWQVTLPGVATTPVTFSPDGRWIAVGTFEGAFVLDRNERTWRLWRRVLVNGSARGWAWFVDGRVGGDREALCAAWFRMGGGLLVPLVRGSSLGDEWKTSP
ncbi:MAG TPA: hypothetical protein PLU22_01945 [Polyangiaceae bacterium]|nr:hypothetical protein [Polyangiaceae bacterium]